MGIWILKKKRERETEIKFSSKEKAHAVTLSGFSFFVR
jgi:hypothetical protein